MEVILKVLFDTWKVLEALMAKPLNPLQKKMCGRGLPKYFKAL